MKPKSDGEIYEQISREAMEKLDPEAYEQIKQALVEWIVEKMDKTERPKKPWYRKGRW